MWNFRLRNKQIEHATEYIKKFQPHKTQDTVIRNFEIIGEASRNIERHPPTFAKDHHLSTLGIRL